MAGAARVHIAERGRDPRRYALVCTGGGGPVHGYSVARKLGITRLVCPPSPGVASAWGLLVAPARVDRVTTVGFRLDTGDLAEFEPAFAELENEARGVVAATGLPLDGARIDRLGDGRCVGQGFDLVVTLPPGPYDDDKIARAACLPLRPRLCREIRPAPPEVPVEFINVRVSLRIAVPGGEVAGLAGGRLGRSGRQGYAAPISPKPAGRSTTSTTATGSAPARVRGPALVEDPARPWSSAPRAPRK